jgi:hypothetical protein
LSVGSVFFASLRLCEKILPDTCEFGLHFGAIAHGQSTRLNPLFMGLSRETEKRRATITSPPHVPMRE